MEVGMAVDQTSESVVTTRGETRPSAAKVTIPVSGMTCAACSARVQRALERSTGVTEASVNLMLKNAQVGYDPGQTTPQSLVEVIRGTGYGAELARPDQSVIEEQEAQERAQEDEYRELRVKASISLTAAVIGMLLSMPLMGGGSMEDGMAMGATDPVIRWVSAVIDPWVRAALPWLYALDGGLLVYLLLATTALV